MSCRRNLLFGTTRLLLDKCKYPLTRQSSNQKTIAIVGDSHVETLLTEEILTNSGLRVIHYLRMLMPFPCANGIKPPKCNKFLINAENKIFQDLKSGDSIVIYNYHPSHLGGANLQDTRHNILSKNQDSVFDSPTKINLYTNGLSRLSQKAFKKSISIYLIGSAYQW